MTMSDSKKIQPARIRKNLVNSIYHPKRPSPPPTKKMSSFILSSALLLATAFPTAAAPPPPAPGIYRGFQQTGGELFMVELALQEEPASQEPTFLGNDGAARPFLGNDGLEWTTWGTDRFEGSGTVSPKKPWMKAQVHKLDPSSKFVAQNWEAGLKNYVVREEQVIGANDEVSLSYAAVGEMSFEELGENDPYYLVSVYSASSGPRQKPGDGSVLQIVRWNAAESVFMGLNETVGMRVCPNLLGSGTTNANCI